MHYRPKVITWLNDIKRKRGWDEDGAFAASKAGESNASLKSKRLAQQRAENMNLIETPTYWLTPVRSGVLEYRQLQFEDQRMPESMFGLFFALIDDLTRTTEVLPKSWKQEFINRFSTPSTRSEWEDDALYYDDSEEISDGEQWPHPRRILQLFHQAQSIPPESNRQGTMENGGNNDRSIIPGLLDLSLHNLHTWEEKKAGPIETWFQYLGNAPIYTPCRIQGGHPTVPNNFALVMNLYKTAINESESESGGTAQQIPRTINPIHLNGFSQFPMVYYLTVSDDLEPGLTQLGAWMGAHWKRLSFLIQAYGPCVPLPEFLIGIVVGEAGKEWNLVASTREQDAEKGGEEKIVVWCGMRFASLSAEDDPFRALDIVRTLRFLDRRFVKEVYWPWLRDHVLLQPSLSSGPLF